MDIYCVDVGSVKRGNFAWACVGDTGGPSDANSSMFELVQRLSNSLTKTGSAALGFECPLYVPFRTEPKELTSRRTIDGSHSWSAAAGAAVLATGMVEATWILKELRQRQPGHSCYLDWSKFNEAKKGLFLWEAFVSGKAKSKSNWGDAQLAVKEFQNRLGDGRLRATEEEPVLSLIGMALLRSRWSTDLRLLEQPCLVVKS